GSPGNISPIDNAKTISVGSRHNRRRRDMSTSSGLTSALAVTVRGSSAIPQIGQLPGARRTISGCIGQTHSVVVVGADGVAGSSAMPQFGHGPGAVVRTSGSIGQT